jgi:hypothetical protein
MLKRFQEYLTKGMLLSGSTVINICVRDAELSKNLDPHQISRY